MKARRIALVPLFALLALPAIGSEPIPHRYEEFFLDSGFQRNRGSDVATVYSETVRIEGAVWIRLFFKDAILGRTSEWKDGSELRITSVEDGAVQVHSRESLEQWQNSSAFFNGDEVLIELVAKPETEPSRISIYEVMVGELPAGPESICGTTDDRILSTDPKTARMAPVGCTGWMIDDGDANNKCFLSAGHCFDGQGLQVVEFNVPLSDPDGSINHPSPDDQYPMDGDSLQWDQTVIGNDWSYFGTWPNSNTGLTAFEAQGDKFVLAQPPAVVGGETIRITGYGSTTGSQGTPLTWSQVQTTHTGPLTSVAGTVLQYAVDTSGGDSGSAVLNEDTGMAIGIHTNAGCSAGGGANSGTGLDNAGVTTALANPQGVCADGAPPLTITLASAISDPIPPAGSTFQVSIVDRDGAPAAFNSADLVYDDGGGDQTAALVAAGGALYDATLPAMACGSALTFRVDVEATNGTTVKHPYSAFYNADRRYIRTVADGFDHSFRDTFETDQGWTVEDDPGLTDGTWERAVPSAFGVRQDPPWDGDSSGSAFLTNPAFGNTDVDGGATRLISPILEATGADPHISYWRWWDDGGISDDVFLVEISDNSGSTWTTLETLGPGGAGGWVFKTFRVADFITPNDQFRIRFTAEDSNTGNIVEAGVDGVVLSNTPSGVICEGIFADGFESGDVTVWSSSVGD